MVTPVQELQYGRVHYLAPFMEEYAETEDDELRGRVEAIGRQIAVHSEKPYFPYRFYVYRDDLPNAYSLMGGNICVSDALVRLYEDDDELAFALAHELAHAALRHNVTRRRLDRILEPKQIQRLRSASFGDEDGDRAIVTKMIQERWGQELELEADVYGALYIVRAGLRLSAAQDALRRLARLSGGPQMDATHHSFDRRIATLGQLEDQLDRVLTAFYDGVAALRAADAERAIDRFNLFVAQFPGDTAGRVNLGSSYLTRLRLRSGTPEGLSENLPILPEPIVSLRGEVYRPDVEAARSQFEIALALDDGDPRILSGLALVQMRRGALAEARELLSSARALEPTDPDLCLCLGNVAYLDGEYPAARQLYAEALSLSPGWPAAMRNLALTAERVGDRETATHWWTELTHDARLRDEAVSRLDLLNPVRSEDETR